MKPAMRVTPMTIRALRTTVMNLGGISHQDRLDLEYNVRHGFLSKGQGGPFPLLKTIYARPGFNFAADRFELVAEMKQLALLDECRLGHKTIFSDAVYA